MVRKGIIRGNLDTPECHCVIVAKTCIRVGFLANIRLDDAIFVEG